MSNTRDSIPPMETPSPARRSAGPRRSDEAHHAILTAAETLLREKGQAGVTFEGVARLAGAGKPTLYRWWPTRAALLFEVYEHLKTRALPPIDTGALASDLVAALGVLWRFWRETPAGRAYVAIIVEAQSDDPTRRTLAGHFEDPNFSLRPLFDRAVARGDLRDADEARILREFVFAMNWLRLLTDRLEEADIPALVATLLGPRKPAK